MDKLFEDFLREKIYLKNITPKTVRFLRQSWAAYKKSVGESTPTKELLNLFVVSMRGRELSPVSCNTYIRGMNTLCTWLFENGHIPTHLKAKQLKEEQKVLKVFSDAQLRILLAWRPSGFYQRRLHTLLCTLIDTGIRIEEALTLERNKVDFDNLLLTVTGKGNKERVIPFSIDLRKVLYKFIARGANTLVFASKSGHKLSYHNMLRDFKALCKELKIEGVRVSFHTLRHGFALNYLRNGGSLFHLQRAMGHEDLETTRKYVNLGTEDLQITHLKTSLLSRLR